MKCRFPYLDRFRAACNAHPVACVAVFFAIVMAAYSAPLPEFALGCALDALEWVSSFLQRQGATHVSAALPAVSAQNLAFTESALSTFVAAACALSLMKLAGLKTPGRADMPAAPAAVQARRRSIMVLSSAVLLAALITCVLSTCALFGQAAPLSVFCPEVLPIVLFLVVCALTGLFEETLFRGIMFDGFALGFVHGNARNPQAAAAVLSSVVFGVLHAPGLFVVPAQFDVVSAMQAIAKPMQASLFGGMMAALYVRTGSLAFPVAFHFLYDAVAGFPLVLSGFGQVTTYVTGNPYDLAAMLCSIIIFAVALAVGSFIGRRRAFCDASSV